MKAFLSPHQGAAGLFFLVGIPLFLITVVAAITSKETTFVSHIPAMIPSILHIIIGWYLIKRAKWAYFLGMLTAITVLIWHAYMILTVDYAQPNIAIIILYPGILFIFIKFKERFNTSHNSA